mgnify:CR=1 FL=1
MAFENYKEAFEKFNEIFFRGRKSIFSNKEILNESNAKFLVNNFTEKGMIAKKTLMRNSKYNYNMLTLI